MKRAGVLLGILSGLVLLLVVGIYVISERAGEVVILHTQDSSGNTLETHLWVVDHEGSPWLRAGQAENGWYRNLESQPRVEMLRADTRRAYRAVPVPTAEAREQIDHLMAEKYGLGGRIIARMHDASDAATVPVRLETPAP